MKYKIHWNGLWRPTWYLVTLAIALLLAYVLLFSDLVWYWRVASLLACVWAGGWTLWFGAMCGDFTDLFRFEKILEKRDG